MMKRYTHLSKIANYVYIGILIILIWSITGCKEDDGPVGPRPTKRVTNS